MQCFCVVVFSLLILSIAFLNLYTKSIEVVLVIDAGMSQLPQVLYWLIVYWWGASSWKCKWNVFVTWPFLITKQLDLLGMKVPPKQYIIAYVIHRAYMLLQLEMVRSSMRFLFVVRHIQPSVIGRCVFMTIRMGETMIYGTIKTHVD